MLLILLITSKQIMAMSSEPQVVEPEEYRVTFKVIPPENTPVDASIYMSGSHNKWPAEKGTLLTKNDDWTYSVTLSRPVGTVMEFKFTRGSWDSVEKGNNGEEIANRVYTFDEGNQVVELKIQRWADIKKSVENVPTISDVQNSTITGNIDVIEDFYMPQLDKKVKISVYLPPDYKRENKRYPVLYMQDGQNLFDNIIADDLEWKVDETLERLYSQQKTEGVIVVGVEHKDDKDNSEYSPWIEKPYIKSANGDKYLDFIVNELKPYIDANYPTLTQRDYTGIAGSDMGGLIALYGGLKYQNIFSKIGALSPALWVADGKIYDFVLGVGKEKEMNIYIYTGGKELGRAQLDKQAVNNANYMADLLQEVGFSPKEIKLTIDNSGIHNESYWSKYFPEALLWLYR